MNIKDYIVKKLEKVFQKLNIDKKYAQVTFSNIPQMSDFQCNSAFMLSKILNQKPFEVAAKIADEMASFSDDFEVTVAGGFINFKLMPKLLSNMEKEYLSKKELGVKLHNTKKKIIMDYGGANVAKELHVGHLRSPLIGESLKRLHTLMGDEVISDTHLGDWGLQMGLTIAQLEEDGYLEFYFNKSTEKRKITLDDLNIAYPKASKRSKTEDSFKKKADEYTLYVQNKKEPYYSIYKEIREASVKAIEYNYGLLNAFFDLWYGESTADPFIEETINIFKSKGLTRVSDGALVVDVARDGEHVPLPKKDPNDLNERVQYKNPMPPTIIQKFNGGDLYATTDLATILMREREIGFDEIFYITDSRQMLHFEQVFRCAKLAGIINDNQKLIHIGFGTICGKDGKPFKTRSGDTVKLEDIINMLKTSAEKKLKENNVDYDDKLALSIGVAAMKFGDLSNVYSKDYIFDLDKFLSFEGKTGPYLQYTAVRIKSLLNKAGFFEEVFNVELPEEKEILINLAKLYESYEICYQDNSLHTLCLSVYNLASSYSTFYNNIKILTETDTKKKNGYLTLSKLVLKSISQALYVLAIDVPEKM